MIEEGRLRTGPDFEEGLEHWNMKQENETFANHWNHYLVMAKGAAGASYPLTLIRWSAWRMTTREFSLGMRSVVG